MSEPLLPTAKPQSPLRRTLGLVLILAFAAVGFFAFGEKVPREQHLRFDVPPVVRGQGLEVRREQLDQLSVQLLTQEGEVAARMQLPLRLESPRTQLAPVSLREGRYQVKAQALFKGISFELEALADLTQGEQVITLSAPKTP